MIRFPSLPCRAPLDCLREERRAPSCTTRGSLAGLVSSPVLGVRAQTVSAKEQIDVGFLLLSAPPRTANPSWQSPCCCPLPSAESTSCSLNWTAARNIDFAHVEWTRDKWPVSHCERHPGNRCRWRSHFSHFSRCQLNPSRTFQLLSGTFSDFRSFVQSPGFCVFAEDAESCTPTNCCSIFFHCTSNTDEDFRLDLSFSFAIPCTADELKLMTQSV